MKLLEFFKFDFEIFEIWVFIPWLFKKYNVKHQKLKICAIRA